MKSADAETVNAILSPILKQDPNWLTFGLSSADGWNLSSFTTAPHSVNIADRDYFQTAIAGHDGVSSVVIARALNAKTIVLAVPVSFTDGTQGVLSGALSLANLEKQMSQIVASTTIELRFVDRLGQEFIGPEATGDTLPDRSTRPEVRDGLAGATSSIIGPDARGRDALVTYAPATRPAWVVILTEPTATA